MQFHLMILYNLTDSTEEEKLLLAAQSLALPVVPAQSAFSKDSDSDLEVQLRQKNFCLADFFSL